MNLKRGVLFTEMLIMMLHQMLLHHKGLLLRVARSLNISPLSHKELLLRLATSLNISLLYQKK